MAKLNSFMSENTIDLNLKAESELEAIAKMIHLAEHSGIALDKQQIGEDLITHEILKPSLKGCCAVVFRVSSESVNSIYVFFGRFQDGIGYFSRSGRPVDLVFLVISPADKVDMCKQLVQNIEQATRNEDLHQKLRKAKTAQEILDILDIEV